MKTHLWVVTASHCVLTWWKGVGDLSGGSLIRALILFIWTLLLEPNHLPRAPFLIPSPWG